jgi:hypothetical protein
MDARNQQPKTSNFHDIDALRGQTVTQLKAKYRELFGDESRSNHKQFLVRRVVEPTRIFKEEDAHSTWPSKPVNDPVGRILRVPCAGPEAGLGSVSAQLGRAAFA